MQLGDKDIQNEVQPIAENVPQAVNDFAAEKESQAAVLAENLGKNENTGLNILNLVLAGLVIGIPTYMGAGWLLEHIPFGTEGAKNMARLGAMFAMRPAMSKLTNFVSGKFLNPVTNTISEKVKDSRNRQFAQNFVNTIQPKPAT